MTEKKRYQIQQGKKDAKKQEQFHALEPSPNVFTTSMSLSGDKSKMPHSISGVLYSSIMVEHVEPISKEKYVG